MTSTEASQSFGVSSRSTTTSNFYPVGFTKNQDLSTDVRKSNQKRQTTNEEM